MVSSFSSQPDTGVIDHERLHSLAKSFRPKLIIAGTSAYSRQLDYARFKKVVLELHEAVEHCAVFADL